MSIKKLGVCVSLQPAHQDSFSSWCFSVMSLFMLEVIHLFFLFWSPLMMTDLLWCFMSFLFLVSLPSLFLNSKTTLASFSSLCFFFKVLAGMNVHPAEFDGLKQEYNVKGYPTFCYFEWVKSSHPSHFRPALACEAQNIRVGPLQTEVQSRSLKHPHKWWWQIHSLQCCSPRFRSCIYQVKRKKFLTCSGIFLYSLWKSKLTVRGWQCWCCRVQLRVTVRDRLHFLI